MSFKTDLIVKRDVTRDDCWIVEKPLVWEDDKYIIKVLAGFDFDFASIPKFMQLFLPKDGQEYDRAACLHDALYASNRLPKDECDRLFYEAMVLDGVPKYRAKYMYKAVQWFGKSAYEATDNELGKYRRFTTVGVKG